MPQNPKTNVKLLSIIHTHAYSLPACVEPKLQFVSFQLSFRRITLSECNNAAHTIKHKEYTCKIYYYYKN